LLAMSVVRSYCDRRYQRSLPKILVIDLGYGHVEFAPKPILQALHYMALVLQRVGVFHPDFEGQYSDCSHLVGQAVGLPWQAISLPHVYHVKSSPDTLSVTNASRISPCLTSAKLSIVTPHSMPVLTSLTSSLNRRREPIFPVWMTTLSRSTRASLERVRM